MSNPKKNHRSVFTSFDRMGQLAIVNAPSSFTFIWSIMKPWLAKETVEKVTVLGKDYKQDLLQLVDAENLPVYFGGNCTCSEAGGCGLSSAGPWMEERLAKKAAANSEVVQSAEPSESTTPTLVPSRRSSSIGSNTRDPALVNAVQDKVDHADSIAAAEALNRQQTA